MNEDRVVGTAKNLGGKAQEGFGRLTGDAKSQVEGAVNQAAGSAQDLYGRLRADLAGLGVDRSMEPATTAAEASVLLSWSF
jgi:uncharacterized protein YjbJ (UPF0337 family)